MNSSSGAEGDTGSQGDKSSPYLRAWIEEQDLLKRKLLVYPDGEDLAWTLSANDDLAASSSSENRPRPLLRYVGGVDVSFSKDDPDVACGALVVVDLLRDLEVVHEAFRVARLQVPYIPGFLAFREAPILLKLLDETKKDACPFYPQLLMVDGNGLLHPRGFGLACHLGVLADLPTIGIGKNLHHVDGLTLSGVRQLLEDRANCTKDLITLTGNSGNIWGAATQSSPGSSKPIFISVGHQISLDSCIKVVKMCCKFRVPEPIRQADIRSRRYLQSMQDSLEQCVCDKVDEGDTSHDEMY